MRGRRKAIAESHLSFLNNYIGKKTLKPEEFKALLVDQESDADMKAQEFKAVMSTQDLAAINDWFGININGKAWRTMWLAERSREQRRMNPRSEQTVHKELAEELKAWARTSDINEAVRALLDAVKDGQ